MVMRDHMSILKKFTMWAIKFLLFTDNSIPRFLKSCGVIIYRHLSNETHISLIQRSLNIQDVAPPPSRAQIVLLS